MNIFDQKLVVLLIRECVTHRMRENAHFSSKSFRVNEINFFTVFLILILILYKNFIRMSKIHHC